MMLFPPTGLEYVATSAKGLASKITLMDLRYEPDLCDTEKFIAYISNQIDILCVSMSWDRQFDEICQMLNRVPDNITLVVGGYTATEKVEELFKRCLTIDNCTQHYDNGLLLSLHAVAQYPQAFYIDILYHLCYDL